MINTGEREAENNQSHILTPTSLGTDNKQVLTFLYYSVIIYQSYYIKRYAKKFIQPTKIY